METKTVEVTVKACLPEYNQVEVVTDDGYRYAITSHTNNVDWSILRVGQKLRCTVTTRYARVLHATLI